MDEGWSKVSDESGAIDFRSTVGQARRDLWIAGRSAKIREMEDLNRITWNPNQMNGQPCIRAMRITVRRVVEAVSIYPNREDLFRNYPELEPEDVRQALAFAAANLEDSAAETPAA